jgi:hypothetical protein
MTPMLMRLAPACIAAALSLCWAQPKGANYDESKVAPYTLPDPLVLENGRPVRDAATWNKLRRPEILHLFERQVYGRTPTEPYQQRFETASTAAGALGGLAVRKQVTIEVTGNRATVKMHLLLYVPAKAQKPVPVFLGLNFGGNHTVAADPGIDLASVWARDPAAADRRSGALAPHIRKVADEKTRGAAAGRWQVEKILQRGYALATIYYGDIEPDYAGGIGYGVRPLLYRAGQTRPDDDEWGAIGAWAWGLSRAVDYLRDDKDIDGRRIAVMGHSRLGKTALWAGAQDQRMALVISNCSGEGGAALSKRNFGETVENLNTAFPHWFCANYRRYNNHADLLPVDAHMLLALIAPRPVYVASAEEDLWADPLGMFLAAVHAGPVYQLLGREGLGTDQMPAIHHPVGHTIAYHIRAGKHDVTAYDWEQYLDFADRELQRPR